MREVEGLKWGGMGAASYLAVVWALLLAACGGGEPAKAPTPEVLTVQSWTETVPIYGEWVGTTAGFVNAQIRSKVEGYLLKQRYQNGGDVKQGEAMFEIDPRQFKAQLQKAEGELGQAQAALGRSRQNVARFRPLAAKGAVSRKELDDAVQTEAANRAAVQSAKAAVTQAQLDVDWTRIDAPIDGVAGIAVAQIGDLVGPATLLTTVSTINPIKVDFPISEQQYLKFRRNQLREPGKLKTRAELILADGSTYSKPGSFYALGREVNPETGTIMVEGRFPNAEGLLRPGQYARVRAMIDQRKNAILVPQRAMNDIQGVFQIAVVGKDDVIEMRTVEVGPTYGTGWVIEKGLAAGERVVVQGLQDIRGGTKVIAKPAPTPTPKAAPAPSSTQGR
ncbi:MAG: efflux RND transporter periplasmic adaptor subunit [Candidatus Binatia bacterium]|nr:efflux RND transporter periplasmic adaptor subunit [Candidatus Binatia bacterium]